MNIAMHVNRLEKSYGDVRVLKGISFDVYEGEIFGLLGVNGAGKTTALECIEGLRKYDCGEIAVHGKTGIQLQSSSLPAHIKAREAVTLFAKWNKTEPNTAMLTELGVDELAKMQYCRLSTGQKRRLHLALSLIGDPDIVFLDEPTAGLDVEGRAALHSQIRKLKAIGKTVVLTSHDMAEVESLCGRIAILKEGVLSFVGTVDELAEKYGKRHTIRIRTDRGTDEFASIDMRDTLPSIMEKYKQENTAVLEITTEGGSLERLFMDIALEGRE